MTMTRWDTGGLMMNERRTTSRSRIPSEAIATRIVLPDGAVLAGSLENISATGATIVGETTGIHTGSVVKVTFPHTESQSTTRECSVKHVEPGRSFGVLFLE